MLTQPNARLLLLTTLVVSGVLLVALWHQRSQLMQLKQDYGRLAEQNQTLQLTLQQTRAEVDERLVSMAAVRGKTAALAVPATPLPPSAPEPKQLVWGGAEVTPISGGLLATLQFKPTKTGPLGDLFLAVEVPPTTAVKILDLKSVGATPMAHSRQRVLRDGKFAIFQGKPGDGNVIKLGVSVSGPVTVDVRGSCGITPFQLDIAPTGATVRSN